MNGGVSAWLEVRFCVRGLVAEKLPRQHIPGTNKISSQLVCFSAESSAERAEYNAQRHTGPRDHSIQE